MDKEAQEKIYELLEMYYSERQQWDGSGDTPEDNTIKRLVGLGYRKLPKDKPPLIKIDPHNYGDTNPADVRLGAEDQREADIKHYEGGDNGQSNSED